MWSSGDPILLRYVHHGRVSRVLPMTVVAADETSTQLYVRPGTTMRTRCDEHGVPIPRDLSYTDRFTRQWTLGNGSWSGSHMLMLTPSGAPYAFWAIWNESWEFQEWYVNLQEPLRRTRVGFDTADHVLDVVVASDGGWHWKDEDELEAACRSGRFTPADARSIRQAGDAAVAAIETRAWPFDSGWSDWQPDLTWGVPTDVPEAWTTAELS